jgi:hypothetical protein
LREKAAKQGGLKKLWLSKEDLEESGEPAAESFDRGELKSDGENEVYPCDECPEVHNFTCSSMNKLKYICFSSILGPSRN